MRFPFLLPLLLALLLMGTSACAKRRPPLTKEEVEYAHVSKEDPGMNAAIARAKATLGEFVQALHDHKPGATNFAVKKPFPVPGGGNEHLWIDVQEVEKDGAFVGVVNNEAEETKEVKLGDKVTVQPAEISDWMYKDHGKLVGGYTLRFFLDQMQPAERAAALKDMDLEL